jgi:hypothetical protein
MNNELLSWMHKRAANGAVGPSTIRGMAPAGTAIIIKEYFYNLDIRAIKARSEKAFISNLDIVTDGLLKKLPAQSRYWGMARKCVNIFIRNCLYNRYISDYYKLPPMEKWLEIPLDSHVGKGLIAYSEPGSLPRWSKVIDLDRANSDLYQKAAFILASKKKVSRIHLDDWLYRGDHVKKKHKSD